ncbi:MAG: MerR family DNA-binding transcriptional regulator [Tannerella sp.]|jgi:predicted secreted protein|nr:MerR family DNA-binding transcriptional regulator [Tannerella sp.]
MERNIVYQITAEDLKAYFDGEYERKDANASLNALLKRYSDVLAGVNEVARMHKISPQTVRNYVRDGLIQPEMRTVERGKYEFRLDYALMLDFKKLKKLAAERKNL